MRERGAAGVDAAGRTLSSWFGRRVGRRGCSCSQVEALVVQSVMLYRTEEWYMLLVPAQAGTVGLRVRELLL